MQKYQISIEDDSAELQESRKMLRWIRSKLRHFLKSKRGYSTEGSTLLPSVLRPRLLAAGVFGLLAIFTLQHLQTSNASAFSLTLTVPDSIALDLNSNSNGGFGEKSVDGLSVKTTSPAGYKLQLGAKSNGNNDLVNSSSNSSKLTSITANTTADNFKNSGTANTWGYKPSKLNGSANSNYKAAPSGSSVDTLDTTNAKNDTANNYSLSLAAKVDSNTVAGSYSNTFVLTATANTLSYNITYNLNSGSWSGTSPQTGNTTSETVTLDSHSPSKSGYTFRGWCSSSSISNNNTTSTPSCSGTTYQPSGKFTLSSASNSLSLYAMWQQNVTYRSYTISYDSGIGSPSNMPSKQSGQAASTSNYYAYISNKQPSLDGYKFGGWCTSAPSNNGTIGVSCSGSTYQINNSFYIPSNGYNVTLYAIWTKPLSGENCVHSGYSGIAKYYGGYCWMWEDYKTERIWKDAQTDCSSIGWRLPSKEEYKALADDIGDSGTGLATTSKLYEAGWNGEYWSISTGYNGGVSTKGPLYLYVSRNTVMTSAGPSVATAKDKVRCVTD